MPEMTGVSLADFTALRVGGPATRLVEITSEADLLEVVRTADEAGEPLLVLGGGSNVVIADDGFDGTVIRVATTGVHVDDTASCESDNIAACGGIIVTAQAGENWDDLVARTLAEEWVGFEALSGIPGLVGATPMQNVGAYGQEVAHTLWTARTYDRVERRIRTFANADCGFAYRTSRFRGSDRYVILQVAYQLRQGNMSAPVRYPELARELGVRLGERVKLAEVRDAVIDLRRRKGMVLDPDDHDTWSVGSFFTNPVLSADAAATLPAAAPRWPERDGAVKTSAAWLIEQAGFHKGYGAGPARLSTKHTLALSNRGTARAADLLALAREVRAVVHAKFGIELQPEPVLVGCTL
jgi:UDP-N-acetylmuramate dehydrogenase